MLRCNGGHTVKVGEDSENKKLKQKTENRKTEKQKNAQTESVDKKI